MRRSPHARGAAARRDKAQLRVLLVEDDEDDFLLTQEMLAESRDVQFALEWVDSYERALETMRQNAFDAVLVDYRLGEQNGLGLLHDAPSLRPGLPIIVLTGLGDRDVDLEAMRLGAADYLVKGATDATLLERSIRYAVSSARALAEIARLNAELEQRVRERTAALEFANKELEAFAFSVSHDLRAPLRIIEGFGQILSEDCAEQLDAEGREHVQRIVRASATMSEMIDALLRLSQAAWVPPRTGRVDLSAIAAEVLDGLRAVDAGREVEIVIAPGVVVDGDETLLRTALTNLLGNAWKFSARSRPARIAFGQQGESGRRVYYVRDNGVGFDMANANRLFGLFQRLHAGDEFPGTGAGLAIVQRIIHRHGGRIWADSRPGHGAVFCFTLGKWQ